jgi:type II secretory pathway component PulF
MSSAASRSFFFVATKPSGGRSMGVRSARSERALAEVLRRDRQVLLRTWALPAWISTESPMKTKDHSVLNDQLAQLLSRGVPLTEALEVVESVIRPQQRPRVERMRELVSGGASFADACRTVGGFDVVTIAVYRAAERTGDLAGAAAQLSETARRQMKISGKATTLMLYPIIVLTIGVLAGIFLLTTIVPTIGETLAESMGEDKIPIYTKIMMAMGVFMRTNWLPLLAAVVVLGIVMLLGREAVGRAIGKVSRGVPILKDVILTQESARFFTVMAALSRSGVPVADGIAVAANAINHPKLRKQFDRLRAKLVEGGVLPRLIDDVDALPVATRRLLIAAERSGDLDTAFETLAEDHTEAVDRQAARLLGALEPLLIVGIFLLIGTMMLAIMVPMLNLSQSVL